MASLGKIVAYFSFTSCSRFAFSGLFDGSTQVVNLNADNFEDIVIKDSNHWAVDLYANWCGACQAFAPHWQTLGRKYSKEKGVVMFGAIDCAMNGDFCRRIGVSKYPELHVWHFPGLSASDQFEGFEIPTRPISSDVDGWLAEQLPKLRPISPPNLPAPAPSDPRVAPPPMQIPDSLPSAVSVVYHLNDAEVGLLFSFRQGVFLQSEKRDIRGESKTVLKQGALSALLRVLDYLALEFPSRQAGKDLEGLAAKVRELVAAGDGFLEYDAWSQALDSQSLDGIPAEAGKDPGTFWRLCRTYTCGLWTLFHIMTTKPPTSSARNASEQDPLAIVYAFVTNFFGCEDCVAHFSKMYDSCDFDRCKVLQMDVKNSSLWLWRAHNAVSKRVAKERRISKHESWPSATTCPKCWGARNKEVEDEIYTFLRQSYWSDAWISGGNALDSTENTGSLVLLVLLLVVIGVACSVVVFSLHCGQDDARSGSFTARRRPADHELSWISQR